MRNPNDGSNTRHVEVRSVCPTASDVMVARTTQPGNSDVATATPERAEGPA